MNRLENKTAIITGAAGGIGLATVRLYLEEGASVVMVDSDEATLSNSFKSLASDRARAFYADIALQDDMENAVKFTCDSFGSVDIAVLNAGIAGANMPLETFPVELFDEVIGVNMRGIWLGLRALIPVMKKQQSGSIVMTSSIQGLSALAGTSAYTTSKHALVGMMKGAALELASEGVRVNAVHPGYVETPMMDSIHRAVSPEAPEAFQQALSSSVPMGRYAKPEEIAQLILFLGSDESSYSTGSSFLADGGILAALPT